MQIYPKAYFEKVQDISIEFLNQHHIKALILDVDNTLIDYEKICQKELSSGAKT